MFLSLTELLDMAIMTAIVGFLFRDLFRPPQKRDILDQYRNIRSADWRHFWFACLLIAPAIIIHEFGHKFLAMAFGLDATFHSACSAADIASGTFFNGICMIQLAAIVMKLMGFGFLIFVPAFVSISGAATPLEHALIAFAGPFVHLVFWLGTKAYLAQSRKLPRQRQVFLFFFQKINMFLFILNILPIPGFDGFKVFAGLFQALF